MGEAKAKISATARLIQKHPICALCGGSRPSVTRDHIPPTCLFDNSHRPDRLVVPACDDCNRLTSTSDLIAGLVSRWRYDSPDQERADHSRLARRIKKQAPEIVDEWTRLRAPDRMQAIFHLRSQGVPTPGDAGIVTVGPRTIQQLNLFAYKLTLGLFFCELGEHLTEKGRLFATWTTKEDHAVRGFPRELLNMLPKYGALQQGRWTTSDVFEYRYDKNARDKLFGYFARLRYSLFVSGYVVADEQMLPNEELNNYWLKPSQVLGILKSAEFEKRH